MPLPLGRNFIRLLGLDGALLFGVGTKAWVAVAGVGSIVLVGTLLSKPAQGYYYTFSSLLALQSFFEMGMTTVLSNFTAHEFLHLHWGERGDIVGQVLARRRVIDLLRKSLRWFLSVAALFALVLLPLGHAFFAHPAGGTPAQLHWRWPWTAAVIVTALNLTLIPFIAVLNGSGEIRQVNRALLIGRVGGSLASWLALFSHHGLYAVALYLLGPVLSIASLLLRRFPALLAELWHAARPAELALEPRISMLREVWPMQWRIAISWFAGFFIFQLFNPLLFHYRGPVEAGQFGITLAAANTIFGIGITWITVRAPQLARTVAAREWKTLDRLFFQGLVRAVSITAVGSVAFLVVLALLRGHTALALRFLPGWQTAALLGAVTVNISVDALAQYLRAHKQEPFAAGSVVTALLQAGISWWGVRHYGSAALVLCFLGVYSLFSLPVSIVIWRRKRREWHGGVQAS